MDFKLEICICLTDTTLVKHSWEYFFARRIEERLLNYTCSSPLSAPLAETWPQRRLCEWYRFAYKLSWFSEPHGSWIQPQLGCRDQNHQKIMLPSQSPPKKLPFPPRQRLLQFSSLVYLLKSPQNEGSGCCWWWVQISFRDLSTSCEAIYQD